ncbi:BnaA08g07480D [Brassica napus]|uniref:BnaA08g07480D protein n=1 Tax=Brassica napus TaxID=3708 RepID=A0A078GKP5_BRANA|nr:BnaA08g07480D [Brassica napus]
MWIISIWCLESTEVDDLERRLT